MALSSVVITGVNGFVGQHLSYEINTQKYEVIGIGRETKPSEGVKTLLKSYYSVDLLDKEAVANLPLLTSRSIIHLAGHAAIGPSFDEPERYIHDNTAMLINLAEAALNQGATPRFIIVSSGAVYSPHQSMPLSESSEIGFTSPYAVSKIAVENLAAYYRSRGLEMIVVRPFNHIGPGQGEGFLLPDLSKQVRECITNNTYEIKVGNLTTKRDYTDVRDVVRAYVLLATKEKVEQGTYNVCSGKSISGEEILELVSSELLKNSNKKLTITLDQSKIRPVDAQEINGDNTKLSVNTGWLPNISLQQTVHDFLAGF